MKLEQVPQALLGLLAQENTNHHQIGQLYNYAVGTPVREVRQVLPLA